MKKKKEWKVWLRRFILAVTAIFLYWINENFIHLSIHEPTCLILIGYFFIGISIVDIILFRILNN